MDWLIVLIGSAAFIYILYITWRIPEIKKAQELDKEHFEKMVVNTVNFYAKLYNIFHIPYGTWWEAAVGAQAVVFQMPDNSQEIAYFHPGEMMEITALELVKTVERRLRGGQTEVKLEIPHYTELSPGNSTRVEPTIFSEPDSGRR